MRKLSVILLFCAVSAFLLVGCKKYEEGPMFSLASKKSRVVNTWKIEKILENNVDVTAANTLFVANFSMELKKDNTYILTGFNGATSVETGTWDFDTKKENIIATPNGSSSATKSEILRLKSNSLWVKQIDGNDVREMHLISK